MAEQIIKKLKRLEEQAMALLVRRTKENMLENPMYKKPLAIPLTFDFEMEFEENITTPKFQEVSKVTEDKSNVIKTQDRTLSFKTMPEPTESNFENLNLGPYLVPANIKKEERKPKEFWGENLKTRPFMHLYYMKDGTEEVNAKPPDTVSSQYKQERQRTVHPTVFSPVPSTLCEVCKKVKRPALFPAQPEKVTGKTADLDDYSKDSSNKRRKLPPQMIDLRTIENKSIKTDQLCQCPAREEYPLALYLNNEPQKVSGKIVRADSAKSDASTEQHESNPIIFHETEFVQNFILTKNRHFSQPLGSRNIYPCKRASTPLGRLREISEPLANDQPATPTNEITKLRACKLKRDTGILEVNGKVVDTQRQATSKQALEKVSQKKTHNLSQSLSELTKKYMGSLDQTILPETKTKSVKYESMFSTEKLVSMHKYSVMPITYCSKPIDRTLQVHFVSTITPLDELNQSELCQMFQLRPTLKERKVPEEAESLQKKLAGGKAERRVFHGLFTPELNLTSQKNFDPPPESPKEHST
ncbi:uncharacterized protein C1orf141 homolog [Sorex fumeus]|uniref:uncharacterized protein C1orf141 homolog n=1 Tax=Sorex fumeus TaxID=62283 RepID=UPI0024ADCC73|nr:uncharacterized protein C1orf141 homolog [Sorex fumeus]